MRAFAQKPKATQQIKPAELAKANPTLPCQRRDIHSIHQLHSMIGNQAVQRLLRANSESLEVEPGTTAATHFAHDFSRIPVFATPPVRIQPKLMVNAPGDMHEQEADRVADQVMRMPEPDQVQQQRAGCEKNELQALSKRWSQTYRPIADKVVQRQIDDLGMQPVQPSGTFDRTVATGRLPSGHTMPVWLQIDLGLHNSPPATGPGSRSLPLVQGTSATQLVSGMRPDAWYRSPVNPDNPVLVWTDGTSLFFGPSVTAVASGQAARPDASFSPLPGYTAEEIQWDRLRGLAAGGPLVVIARRTRAPDFVVSINEDLSQVTYFTGLGVRSGGARHVTCEGTEFLQADNTTVPLAIAEATARGAIHAVRFRHGFFRYRGQGGSDDLYVAQGANPAVYIVERSTGTIRRTFTSGTVNAVVPVAAGVVGVEITTGTPGAAQTVNIDLRTTPATTTTSPGHATSEAGYAAVRARLVGMGVVIVENGVRFRVAELTAVENALTLGGNRGLTVLQNLRTLPRMGSNPLLQLEKTLGPDGARGTAGIIGANLWIREPFDEASDRRVSTVRHEMTHIIMEATDAVTRHGMSSAARGAQTSEMRRRAAEGRRRETAGTLRLGERRAGDPTATPASVGTWRGAVGQDPDLAAIFLDLLETRSFIPDPEGTGDRRGIALADESRYTNASSRAGHPSENVDEFVASFVTSATVYRTQFEASVLSAELAGNRSGGSAGSDLRRLYERAWTRIDALYVPLGSNPFTSLPGQQSVAFIRVPSTISLAQIIRANNLVSQGIDVAALQRLNPEIRSNSTVAAGTVIWLRAREVPALATGFEAIADRYFGSRYHWPTLWRFNPEIRDPRSIQPTTRIHLQSAADRARFGEVSLSQ
jgi:hypothetical protein